MTQLIKKEETIRGVTERNTITSDIVTNNKGKKLAVIVIVSKLIHKTGSSTQAGDILLTIDEVEELSAKLTDLAEEMRE